VRSPLCLPLCRPSLNPSRGRGLYVVDSIPMDFVDFRGGKPEFAHWHGLDKSEIGLCQPGGLQSRTACRVLPKWASAMWWQDATRVDRGWFMNRPSWTIAHRHGDFKLSLWPGGYPSSACRISIGDPPLPMTAVWFGAPYSPPILKKELRAAERLRAGPMGMFWVNNP